MMGGTRLLHSTSNFQFDFPWKSMRLTATHLIESGGTFIEARLTCVRLNAELKNWRKVGRESLAFLEKGQYRKNRKIWKQRGRGAPRRAFKLNLNQADRKIGWHWSITRARMTGGLDTLIKSDREFAVDKQSNDRGGTREGREPEEGWSKKDARCDIWVSIISTRQHEKVKSALITAIT